MSRIKKWTITLFWIAQIEVYLAMKLKLLLLKYCLQKNTFLGLEDNKANHLYKRQNKMIMLVSSLLLQGSIKSKPRNNLLVIKNNKKNNLL